MAGEHPESFSGARGGDGNAVMTANAAAAFHTEDNMAYECVNITGVVKDEHDPHEVYLFVWCDSRRQDLLRQFGRFASNPELSFTWYDAAKASSNIAEATRDNYTGV